MASKIKSGSEIYYIAGRHQKVQLKEPGKYEKGVDGKVETCTSVIKNDPLRKKFKERFLSDQYFRENTLRWTKKSKEQYIKDWEQDTVPGPKNKIKHGDQEMVSTMYELGERVGMDGPDKVKVKTADGSTKTFKCGNGQSETCPYDESHDGPADDLPDDVTQLKGFGEASLLLLMKRRLVEKLTIYTYVGDVVLCLNPYMYIPAMVDIQPYPNVKKYSLGKEPHSYASAHFAYWGVVTPDPDQKHRNQSCIVSGESGAGKTVACGFIMDYLAKLSEWRQRDNGETIEEGPKKERTIAKRVGGVSPFLEAFGNAKTNMNDNSSRFGKFTMIQIKDGQVTGAEMENYLLEKARLCDQGVGERNYHIFYFLIKGATPEEKKIFKLKNVEDYDMLMHGHTAIIDNETDRETGKNTYDTERMNNPLAEKADDTGVRAALEDAKVDKDMQMNLWKVVVALLKMAGLTFKAAQVDYEGSKTPGSVLNEQDVCAEIESLLGIKDLAKMLCIFRRTIQGSNIDAPTVPNKTMNNRDALVKDIYGRIFDWLIHDVCNGRLKPSGDSDGFVGLLDIFGFEVFQKNSIEQLCINFANEKLQWLFNDHIFEIERNTYESEGLPADCIPPYKNNTPCCELVEKGGKYGGVLPTLDDFKNTKPDDGKNHDEIYCERLVKRWGRKVDDKGSCKKKREILSSGYFRAKKIAGFEWFEIKHFAGWVRYHVDHWVEKNKDQLPLQLTSMMEASTHPLLTQVYGHKGSKDKTLASKFKKQLSSLANTLQATTPHYVRCVKPNDIHFRPVDGTAAFDHWKTFRQLKFAGVMEVVRIKKEGYPFRVTYETFWKMCIDKKYAKAAPGVDESMDPRSGSEAIAQKWLPEKDSKGERRYWVLGKTMLFGKQDTTEKLLQQHQKCVSGLVRGWARYNVTYGAKYKNFIWAQRLIVDKWRVRLEKRRLAKIEAQVIVAQAALRAVKARALLARKREKQAAVRKVQRAFVPFHLWKDWDEIRYNLGRIELVRANAVKIQTSYRNFEEYPSWVEAMRKVIRLHASQDLGAFVKINVDRISQDLARHNVGKKLIVRLRQLRSLVRVQAHLRRSIAGGDFVELQRQLEIVRQASYISHGLYMMISYRVMFQGMHKAALRIQRSIFRRRIGLPTQVWWMWTPDGDLAPGQRRRLFPHSGRVNYALEQGWQQLWNSADASTLDVKVVSKSSTKVLYGSGRSQTSVLIEKSRPRGPFVQLSHRDKALVYRVKFRRTFRQIRETAICVQRYVRGFLAYIRRCRVVAETRRVQKWHRMITLRKKYMRAKNAARTIEIKFLLACLVKKRLKRWIDEMCSASMRGDVPEMRELLFCDEPWERLAPLRSERLPVYGGGPLIDVPGLVNLRHPFYFTSFLHMAVKSGAFNAVKLLLSEGATVESRSSFLETPMHVSCGVGDELLRISKLLYACATYKRPGSSRRWIISDDAMTSSGDTVFDVAIACFEPKQLTLEWLQGLHAASNMDPDDILAEERMRQQYVEAQDRKMEAYAAEVEQKERDSDKLYQYLMLESSDTQREVERAKAMRKRYEHYRSEEFQDEFRAKIVLGDPEEETNASGDDGIESARVLKAAAEASAPFASSPAHVSPLRSSPLLPRGVSTHFASEQKRSAAPSSARRTPRQRHRDGRIGEREAERKRASDAKTMQRLKEMRSRLKTRTSSRQKRRRELARRQRDEAYKNYHERRKALALEERDRAYARSVDIDADQKIPAGGVVAVDEEDEAENGDATQWATAVDPGTGRTYYYNVKTRETSWSRPKTSPSSSTASGRRSPSGKKGYVSLEDLRQRDGGVTSNGVGGAGRDLDATGGGSHALLQREMERQRALQTKLDFLKSQMETKRVRRAETAGALKMAMIRALVAESEAGGGASRGWYYRDQSGRQQGPYSSRKMSKWYREGYIADDLLLRLGRKGPFLPMHEIFAGSGAANPFLFTGKRDLVGAFERISEQLEFSRIRHRSP
eukprot:g1267.t1